MGANSFKELRRHVGHRIMCVSYHGRNYIRDYENVALECLDCNEVLLDFDKIPVFILTEVHPCDVWMGQIDLGEEFIPLENHSVWYTGHVKGYMYGNFRRVKTGEVTTFYAVKFKVKK